MADDHDNAAQDAAVWKRKYLASLQELEAREGRWRRLEGLLRSTAVRLSLLAQGRAPDLDKHLERLRQQLRRGRDEDLAKLEDGVDELERLVRRLGLLLSDSQRRGDGGKLKGGDAPSVNEALLQLLEHLELPAGLGQRVEELRERLERPVAEGEWPDLLKAIAELIACVRARAQEEKKELEEFLSELTARLVELDAYVQNMESDRRDALDSGRTLDQAVQEQVRGIHSSVHEAVDLGRLRLSIEQRLQAIGNHMEEFRRHEEERSVEAEKHIEQLNERLHLMEREASELRARVHEERQLALVDTLTEVHNRMAYDERIEQEYVRWKRFGEPLSLVMADIDNFKDINDTYGHVTGDKVLRTIAKLLKSQIRESDFLARYGGEEFVVLMPGAGAPDARAVAEKLRREVEHCDFNHCGTGVSITISCGIAQFHDGDDPVRVFERADNALYRAKELGRNRSELADA
ncbi:MAG: GGDEF domain-containing protein [Gammaproteobacteria bacterium]|nr:GGDEF domain-containing protein [Gammaproteobacteria bacterium]NIR97505.1 GGDEF domain-containing protein [Gammaproteobacteria bacterium]NIX10252.1 diguanylate cyclase [Gammaproteobacteria bacterium]